MAEIESTTEMDLILRGVAIPTNGEGRHKPEVVGSRSPSEVVTAADRAGLTNALRHLPDDAITAINPGHVVAYARRRAGLQTTEVARPSPGGAS